MMKNRQVITLIILVLVGLGVAFFNFVYTPQLEMAYSLQVELDTNTKLLSELKAMENDAEDYRKKVENLDTQIQSISTKIPSAKDVPGVLVELYRMIIENKLEGKSISFSNINEGQKYNFFDVSFEVKGEKENVYSFLRQLENFKREISFESIKFFAEGDLLRTSIVIKNYILKDSKNTGTVANYDFLDGKYGVSQNWYDMFKNMDGGGKNPIEAGNDNVADETIDISEVPGSNEFEEDFDEDINGEVDNDQSEEIQQPNEDTGEIFDRPGGEIDTTDSGEQIDTVDRDSIDGGASP